MRVDRKTPSQEALQYIFLLSYEGVNKSTTSNAQHGVPGDVKTGSSKFSR